MKLWRGNRDVTEQKEDPVIRETVEDPVTSRPMCNIHIDLTGWNRGYDDIRHFLNVAHDTKKVIGYMGDHTVLENGFLVPGKRSGLHTYSAEIDVDESVSSPHLHLVGGKVVRLADITLRLEDCIVDKPRYTLSGLYETLPNNQMNTRMRALREYLTEVGFQDESIAARKETRLKLLETHYRRLISDQ